MALISEPARSAGKEADFIAIERDPTADISAIRVIIVINKGKSLLIASVGEAVDDCREESGLSTDPSRQPMHDVQR